MRHRSFLVDILAKFPRLLGANVALCVVMSLFDAVSFLFIAPIVDLFMNPQVELASPLTRQLAVAMRWVGVPLTLGSALAAFLIFNVVKSGVQIVARHSILKTKYALLRELWMGTFNDFFHARWQFFSTGRQGTFLNTFLREMTIVGDAFGAMALFFANALQLVLYLAVPLYISWPVTVISLFAACVFAWPFVLLGRMNYRLGQRNTATANAVGAVIQESLGAAKLILGFNNQRKHLDSLGRAFDAHRGVTLTSQTLNIAIPLLYYPCGLVVLTIALFASRRFGVQLSEAAVLFYSLLKVIPSIGGLTAQKNSLDNFFPSYEQVMDLRRRARQWQQTSGDQPFIGFSREIALEHVSFAHPGREPALTDVTVRIPKSTMTAIVGESGAGKSTLIDLLMAFHDPAQGQVVVDGVSVRDFDVWSYRQRIGYVPQDSLLFNATIRENLRWANDAASDEELARACRQANAQEFITSLPDGYDTVVGDRGVRLSGGQVQRIALARALLREPELLILDEATSALDTVSERLIQQAIETVAKRTTVVVIAHRLSTIVNADYIYVLEEGCVVEEGTYAELRERRGVFNQMVRLQVMESTRERHAEAVAP